MSEDNKPKKAKKPGKWANYEEGFEFNHEVTNQRMQIRNGRPVPMCNYNYDECSAKGQAPGFYYFCKKDWTNSLTHDQQNFYRTKSNFYKKLRQDKAAQNKIKKQPKIFNMFVACYCTKITICPLKKESVC